MKHRTFRHASHRERVLAWRSGQLQSATRRFAPTVVFATLLIVCWLLGGASQRNIVVMSVLELVSLVGLSVVVLLRGPPSLPRQTRPLWLIVAAFTGLSFVQLIPLPWSVWSALPGHGAVARASDLLELPRTAHTISLVPERTVSALLQCIPSIAVFVLALALPWRMLFAIVRWGALAIGVLSASIAIVQAAVGPEAQLHLYDWTKEGAAAGLFANADHQATFLLMCLPFVFLLGMRARILWARGAKGGEQFRPIVAAGGVLILGIVLGGSLNGYLLIPLVAIGCTVLIAPPFKSIDVKYLAGALVVTVILTVAVMGAQKLLGLGHSGDIGGDRTRPGIHADTLRAIFDFLPFGSGFGSFEQVYPLYERGDPVATTFVNHAHNDYLEIALEFGIPGVVLMLLFLVWWGRETWRIWRRPPDLGSFHRMKMAASLGVAVVLIHSLVDYPVRAASISTFLAVCLAIVVRKRPPLWKSDLSMRAQLLLANASAGRPKSLGHSGDDVSW